MSYLSIKSILKMISVVEGHDIPIPLLGMQQLSVFDPQAGSVPKTRTRYFRFASHGFEVQRYTVHEAQYMFTCMSIFVFFVLHCFARKLYIGLPDIKSRATFVYLHNWIYVESAHISAVRYIFIFFFGFFLLLAAFVTALRLYVIAWLPWLHGSVPWMSG